MDRIFEERALNIPNLLTAIRILLLPVIVWRFHMGDRRGALLLYLAAMITDVADGFAARKMNQITSLGKLLDPIADKLCLLTLMFLFVSDRQIPAWIFGIVAAKEAVFILGSAAALRFGIVVSALPIGKITTLFFALSTILRFLLLRMLADVLLWMSMLLLCVSIIWYGAALACKLHTEKVVA